MPRLFLSLLLTGSLATACLQTPDPGGAASGKTEGGGVFPPGTTPPAATPPPPPPPSPPPGAVTDGGVVSSVTCETVNSDALRILQTNCAGCHQLPNNVANFSFILDVDRLVMSTSSTGKRFMTPGNPDESRIYERVMKNEMPPPLVMQRPTAEDKVRLWQWISSCAQYQVNRGGFGKLDAGSPDVMAEPPPEPCASNNTCASGGCCVNGYCRPNGKACSSALTGDNIPGTCTNGSCVAAGSPPCGNLNQACCGALKICTGTGTVCPTGSATCQACGKMGGRCCQVGGQANCDPGLGCVVMATGDPGTCKPCGQRGQDCCGLGFRRTCNNGLTCNFVGGAKFTCGDAGGGQQPPDAGRPPPDAGGGGGQQQRDAGRG